MKATYYSILVFLLLSIDPVDAQVSARMFQYPDVSATQIAFVYGGDIWIAPKEGGTAIRLSTPEGQEAFPRFSPDGSSIAFSGNYDGNIDVYVLPSMGGVPTRLTYHDKNDRIIDWTPDGKEVLFASSRNSERQRYSQFFTIDRTGGQAKQMIIPYGEFGAFSPDGKSFAYVEKSRSFRTWKRYQGGMAADITLYDLEANTSANITNHIGNDEHPMWHGDILYYLSDRGPEQRFNIWKYDLKTKEHSQVTAMTDMDVHFPSIGPGEIVFEAGGELFLLDLATEKFKTVDIRVVSDQASLLPRKVDLKKRVDFASVSPDGKRAVIESRGELFSVPAEKGFVKNLTQSSGTAERYPSWSPDGKYFAYWSDKSGEYQLVVQSTTNPKDIKTLTEFQSGYRYQIYWSPDSEKLVFIDQTQTFSVYDRKSGQLHEIDQDLWLFQGGLTSFKVSWSPDSRWIAYDKGLDNRQDALFLYDTREKRSYQLTSGFYNDSEPVFDPEGKYLYFISERNFSPEYSSLDNTWIYTNTSHIAAASLNDTISSPIAPENDVAEVQEDEKEEKPGDKKEKSKDEEGEEDTEEEDKEIHIQPANFESRVVLLDIEPGNYFHLQSVKGKLLYRKSSIGEDKTPLLYYDVKERETKKILDDVDGYDLAAGGEKVLVHLKGDYSVIDIKEDAKMEEKLPLADMTMQLSPQEEWKQIFQDVWRFERDFFYDKNMHGVNWDALREQYGSLVDNAITRWDLNYIIGELIGELNASHTYRGGGDTEESANDNMGYLGINWALKGEYFQVAEILRGAAWDVEQRSPLDEPSVKIDSGSYILAVNGVALDPKKEPYSAFRGLAGKTVEITWNDKPGWEGSKTDIVRLLSSEDRLRHLAWIEKNRKRVDEASGGKIGYIYVRSTGVDGQNELYRQFRAQFHKEGLIIDERFNSGGQIPDRFIELLDRKPLAFWSVRDGKDWQWPPVAHFGPKAMLINGWSGSGGDAFPDYFRKAGLGPLIGTRTWGGLIGISGAPGLIDGGGVTVPTFRMYNPDGTWFKEGHGVEPDIEIKEDPAALVKGVDPQLEKAIEEVMASIKKEKAALPKKPGQEDRT